MIVYNITFHIENEVLNQALAFLKKSYIPRLAESGFFLSPCLRRILHTAEEEGVSYAVQFHVKNIETLNYWLTHEGKGIHKELTDRFGDKMTGFSTLLEEIDWEQ